MGNRWISGLLSLSIVVFCLVYHRKNDFAIGPIARTVHVPDNLFFEPVRQVFDREAQTESAQGEKNIRRSADILRATLHRMVRGSREVTLKKAD
ncbi:hypothetical protein HYU92_00120 [Candidatus Curtissbacteria bacterium]|nr:hypothetical protein [Candidatus Curtissbacteria bacterium]